jgi:tubby-related protein 1|uniref:Tubby C-terminal domain-containing protein n=1 Tax=Globisporangium ultimum (strain ATCC 200006 / CBS 805.95 / DAOM BR144) TaxID=431595 RepID=K3WNH4_GLOUD
MQRKVSEQNQVMPFRLDDGEDDFEEIRRRRYSSSCSSSSSSSEAPSSRQSHASAKGNKKKSSNSSLRERSNEWEKASSQAASSSNEDHDDEDSYDEDEDGRKARNRQLEEPESPRNKARRHRRTQQSDEESGSEDDGKYAVRGPATASAAKESINTEITAKLSTSLFLPADLSRISKLAVFPGSENQLLQGHIVRVKTLLHPQYHFFIKDQLILMAEKQLKNRTSNYHVFDMTRSTALASRLTKKSGNYLGKLRSNFSKKKNVLVGNWSQKTELGAILFGNSTAANEPRHLTVILPPLSAKHQEIEGLTVADSSATSPSLLIDLYKSSHASVSSPKMPTCALQVFENKEPVFDNGFYRLNFNGRVSVPSVKNFQLVRQSSNGNTGAAAKAETETVYLQFGKVDDKKFHLDFRAPLTPLQAFAIALAQFNL